MNCCLARQEIIIDRSRSNINKVCPREAIDEVEIDVALTFINLGIMCMTYRYCRIVSLTGPGTSIRHALPFISSASSD